MSGQGQGAGRQRPHMQVVYAQHAGQHGKIMADRIELDGERYAFHQYMNGFAQQPDRRYADQPQTLRRGKK